ncbi:hypothetical protein [Paenibacillus sp. MER 99-2]|uniref:hypothetical protein n=1 Tax=Paenibacillus sp. MER 99-2 TaxID=2939572 RepID=UPI0020410FF3|nr:hypothetical protein [Paenibacillus sp. MER 99-2]MCM3175937.1 hypothetical protein [Paenibacillus sp. MER 99-2]
MTNQKSYSEVMSDVQRDFMHLLMLPDAEGTAEEKSETLRFGAECIATKYEHLGLTTPESRDVVVDGIAAVIKLLGEVGANG